MIRLHLGLPLQQVVMETVLPLSQSTKKSQSKTRIRHTLSRLIIRGFSLYTSDGSGSTGQMEGNCGFCQRGKVASADLMCARFTQCFALQRPFPTIT